AAQVLRCSPSRKTTARQEELLAPPAAKPQLGAIKREGLSSQRVGFAIRNVSTTLIQPSSEFRLGVLGSASVAGDSRCRDAEGHLWICGQRKRVAHNPTGAAATKTKT